MALFQEVLFFFSLQNFYAQSTIKIFSIKFPYMSSDKAFSCLYVTPV